MEDSFFAQQGADAAAPNLSETASAAFLEAHRAWVALVGLYVESDSRGEPSDPRPMDIAWQHRERALRLVRSHQPVTPADHLARVTVASTLADWSPCEDPDVVEFILQVLREVLEFVGSDADPGEGWSALARFQGALTEARLLVTNAEQTPCPDPEVGRSALALMKIVARTLEMSCQTLGPNDVWARGTTSDGQRQLK